MARRSRHDGGRLIMASVGTSYIASARADGEGRLVEASEPLASLQEACGGQIGGPIAIPELQALVDKLPSGAERIRPCPRCSGSPAYCTS